MADRNQAYRDRLARRTRTGLVLGALVGAIGGLVIGAIAGGGHASSIIMWTVSAALAGLVIGGIWGGFGGLESPDPGAEPSESTEPLAEPPVTEEHDRQRPEI
jgi:hypothetical protein